MSMNSAEIDFIQDEEEEVSFLHLLDQDQLKVATEKMSLYALIAYASTSREAHRDVRSLRTSVHSELYLSNHLVISIKTPKHGQVLWCFMKSSDQADDTPKKTFRLRNHRFEASRMVEEKEKVYYITTVTRTPLNTMIAAYNELNTIFECQLSFVNFEAHFFDRFMKLFLWNVMQKARNFRLVFKRELFNGNRDTHAEELKFFMTQYQKDTLVLDCNWINDRIFLHVRRIKVPLLEINGTEWTTGNTFHHFASSIIRLHGTHDRLLNNSMISFIKYWHKTNYIGPSMIEIEDLTWRPNFNELFADMHLCKAYFYEEEREYLNKRYDKIPKFDEIKQLRREDNKRLRVILYRNRKTNEKGEMEVKYGLTLFIRKPNL